MKTKKRSSKSAQAFGPAILLFGQLTATAWNPPPSYTVSQWAEKFRYLSSEYSALPGRYSLRTVPYAREPMDCANDNQVRVVVLMWGSQLTKTTLLENVNGYHVHADPSPQLMVQPTVEMAQAWSKERLSATIRDTPVLRDLISDQRSRDSNNTIQLKTYPGGNVAIIGANAPAGLAGRPRRVVLLDEVDRYPASAGTEGDPVALAIRRTESFHNSVIYLTSTPTVKNFSRIEAEYQQTDQRKWFVPCPYCSHFQTLEWAFVKWQQNKPETAWYQCRNCEAKWTDVERVAAIRQGEWRPTAPFNGKRGYFLNGICSPFKPKRGFKNRLHQMAIDFLEAKQGGPETMKTWTNTFLAQTWEEEADKIDVVEVNNRCEHYTPDTLPDDVVLVVAGADVQKDRVEVEFIGVGNQEETWGIEVVKVNGDTEQPDTWKRLSDAIDREFRRQDKTPLRCTALCIDAHYRPKATREWAYHHGTRVRVWPLIGVQSHQGSMVAVRKKGFTVSTDAAKDIIFQRLRIKNCGPRYCHYPVGYGYTDEFFTQLTSERAVTRYTKGFPKRIYEKDPGARNEALDMRVYALACLDILRPNIPQIAASLKSGKIGDKTPPHPLARSAPPRGGWMSGWKT